MATTNPIQVTRARFGDSSRISNEPFARRMFDRIMSFYASDAVVFNVKPPFQTRGAKDWRREWETALAHFPASFGIETRDLMIAVSGDLALAHSIWRFTGMPGQT